jgi:hypothetical protein
MLDWKRLAPFLNPGVHVFILVILEVEAPIVYDCYGGFKSAPDTDRKYGSLVLRASAYFVI